MEAFRRAVAQSRPNVFLDVGAQFVLMRLRGPFEVSLAEARRLIERSGAKYALLDTAEYKVLERYGVEGLRRLNRQDRLDAVVALNDLMTRCVDMGTKLARRRVVVNARMKGLAVTSPSYNGGVAARTAAPSSRGQSRAASSIASRGDSATQEATPSYGGPAVVSTMPEGPAGVPAPRVPTRPAGAAPRSFGARVGGTRDEPPAPSTDTGRRLSVGDGGAPVSSNSSNSACASEA
jgi:hypothetical protein